LHVDASTTRSWKASATFRVPRTLRSATVAGSSSPAGGVLVRREVDAPGAVRGEQREMVAVEDVLRSVEDEGRGAGATEEVDDAAAEVPVSAGDDDGEAVETRERGGALRAAEEVGDGGHEGASSASSSPSA
jgi:hypothetical protein